MIEHKVILALVILVLVLTTGCCGWPYDRVDSNGVCYKLINVCNKAPGGGYICKEYRQNLIRGSETEVIPTNDDNILDFCDPSDPNAQNAYGQQIYKGDCFAGPFVPVTPTPTPTEDPAACTGGNCYSNPITVYTAPGSPPASNPSKCPSC